MNREVFLVSAARTPIGSFQGALSSRSAVQLGTAAIRGALERAGLEGAQVDETFMGNVMPAALGQAPARQAAIHAGIPHPVPATTVSKVCGSGMQALLFGAKSILLGDAEVVVAGGMESMSNVPYVLPKGRAGYRMGHGQVLDSMLLDGLWDPYGDFHMGRAGDLCAREQGFSREQQDAFARESYRRALAAQAQGRTADEIVAVTLSGKHGDTVVDQDEEPGRGKPDKAASLRPAFTPDGTVTAFNASKINDGAAALVLASGEAVRRLGLTPMARLRAYGGHAQAPEQFPTAPVFAVHKALSRAGLSAGEVDVYEINEAFSSVAMVCENQLDISHERTNVRGGAVALGHPIGATGARIVVTLLHVMAERGARRGVASLCIGGGEALAVVVEDVRAA